MTIEDELKEFIVMKYGSITKFCKTINMSQSTLSTIFKRGIQRTSITKIFAICDELNISSDALAEGHIIPKELVESKEYSEYFYIFDKMLIDGKPLNDYEKWSLKKNFESAVQALKEQRNKFPIDIIGFDEKSGVYIIESKTGHYGQEMSYFKQALEQYKAVHGDDENQGAE